MRASASRRSAAASSSGRGTTSWTRFAPATSRRIPTRFLIDPKDHIDARRRARAQGLDVVGFYHSHPHSPPDPSSSDEAEASYPDHLYLIVGLASEPPDVRLYRLDAAHFVASPFVVC